MPIFEYLVLVSDTRIHKSGFSARFLIPGFRYQVSYTWFQIPGFGYLVASARFQILVLDTRFWIPGFIKLVSVSGFGYLELQMQEIRYLF